MLVHITSLLRSIVSAPWFIFRPLLVHGRGPTSLTPSARAKARALANKSSTARSPQPKQTKQNIIRMEAANGTNGTAPIMSYEEKSKLEEQATAKGELSYSYWAGKGGGNVPLPEPRKLTEQEKAELERQASASAASAWNAAGTFEERGATPWAKSRLTELILKRELPGGDVTMVDVNSCEGEANIFIVRGKKRCGFDFELQLAWKATPRPEAIEIRGHCKVLNFSSDDPDDLEVQPEVSHRQPDRAADEAAALARVKTVLQSELVKILGQLLEELKAR
ncbi:hypothetical protein Vretimale_5509 [Volvox reticuliferus]|uniref:Activator of Hsp90 ATPase AHSA1-like N-terminal domain-containing protein n=1 Tax=Volvox reticuliferus TaxID=1737510 RepID=A0A8J4C5J4_9CHLO|nr:hypothetical protein Vretifemale_5564 [Volvox reticuliferus]GIM00646.1 hypothetical protein Vretimale_5509 [Volvox reticuliferus]